MWITPKEYRENVLDGAVTTAICGVGLPLVGAAVDFAFATKAGTPIGFVAGAAIWGWNGLELIAGQLSRYPWDVRPGKGASMVGSAFLLAATAFGVSHVKSELEQRRENISMTQRHAPLTHPSKMKIIANQNENGLPVYRSGPNIR